MKKVVFLCRGNVGRSQIAEALCKRYHGDTYEVSSAGTKLSGPEQPIGDLIPATQYVLDVMTEEGIDISQSIRKQLTAEMVDGADVVVALLEDDELPEYLVSSPKLIRWYVTDPKGKDLIETREIKEVIKGLVQKADFGIKLLNN